uniref:Transcriptional activator protein n=1 Tax=Tobacco leaf curl Zimbabwe virus TaxID=223337 RepID=A7DXG4_9GEMI|nr:C2 protein [Tobacco leaf curl Zimbabwe virus]
MQHSSPSTGHSTQIPIKVLHRKAKTKAIRRKRIDLDCGCSYYIHIGCRNHGFTHRGRHHCASSSEWRFYLGDNKSALFQNNQTPHKTVLQELQHHTPSNTIQPQPQEDIGDSQMFSQLPGLDDLTASDWSFLKSI